MKKIKILLLENVAKDAALIKKYLERNEMKFEVPVVTSEIELMKALEENDFDIILADHSLASFEALKMARKKDANIPFILIGGTMTEETAIDIMKVEGADDYILIDHLKRLPTAIRKAIEHRDIKRENEHCQDKLAEKSLTLLKYLN